MNAPAAISDASDIAAIVLRARALLDDGDVLAARMLAAGAYDQAKAAAGYAQRFGAAERLVGKARQLQGDSLLIETRAKIQISKEYDAAQASGEVASRGRPKNLPDGNVISQREIGLTAKEIHEARKLAAAEDQAPGIVERAIAARLEAGLEPSRASLRANIGTKTATKEDRGHNLYETPIEAMRTLLALERFHSLPGLLEPACGKGAILRPLEDAGYEVAIADLVDYGTVTRHGECQSVGDFLETTDSTGRDIVGNPPYGDVLNKFIAHALRVHRPRKMALLLNLNFLCGFDDSERCFAMDENPPSRVIVFSRRLPMMHRDGWEGPRASSSMNTAWFVWELDRHGRYSGPAALSRVDWKDFQDRPALPPLTQKPARAANIGVTDALIDVEAAKAVERKSARKSARV